MGWKTSSGNQVLGKISKVFLLALLCLGMASMLMLTGVPTHAPQAVVEAAVAPKLDAVSPDIGLVGTQVTLSGSGFESSQGKGYVSFGATRAVEYISWSDTEIKVRVPKTGQGEVEVKVTTNSYFSTSTVKLLVVSNITCFAEGNTGTGFQEFLCIGNSQSYYSEVTILLILDNGDVEGETLNVKPNSRATVNVNTLAGVGREVSAMIMSEIEVAIERPMYFNYRGRWTGGHDVVATPYNISKIWFFAEGYTGPGFDEWICVFNPGEDPANLTFNFQVKGEGEHVIKASVAAESRRSFKVNDLLGPNHQCSLALESDQYVVAERSMYFDYLSAGRQHWEGGHCVMGAMDLSREFYFAEGTTRAGFEEWITLQNPNAAAITVVATYQPGEGQGDPIRVSHVIPPQSRETLYVPGDVGTGKDVSVKLASSDFFLAERPMYFRYGAYGASWEGGHCVIGATELSPEWYFAEGCTNPGFHEWLTLQNPGEADCSVEVNYLGNGGSLALKPLVVPARSRKTLLVNNEAGPNLELSCRLRVTSGPSIVAERPMYFIFRGWDGGHDVVGYKPFDFYDMAGDSGYRSAVLHVQDRLLQLQVGAEI